MFSRFRSALALPVARQRAGRVEVKLAADCSYATTGPPAPSWAPGGVRPGRRREVMRQASSSRTSCFDILARNATLEAAIGKPWRIGAMQPRRETPARHDHAQRIAPTSAVPARSDGRPCGSVAVSSRLRACARSRATSLPYERNSRGPDCLALTALYACASSSCHGSPWSAQGGHQRVRRDGGPTTGSARIRCYLLAGGLRTTFGSRAYRLAVRPSSRSSSSKASSEPAGSLWAMPWWQSMQVWPSFNDN